MSYKLELSTRPAKALGEPALWDIAEAQLAEALNDFIGEGNWKINPGYSQILIITMYASNKHLYYLC
jgi:threonyl-tRNA synthetase